MREECTIFSLRTPSIFTWDFLFFESSFTKLKGRV